MKSRKNNWVLIFFIFLLFSIKAYPNSKFEFSADYTLFKFGGKYLLEVYCSFYEKGLNYEFKNGSFEGAGLLDLVIVNKFTNETVYSILNKVPIKENDTSGNNLNKRLVVQKNISLNTGDYKLIAIGKDFNDTTSSGTKIIEFLIPEITNAPSISGIELSSYIAKSTDTSSYFYKFGFEVIPNPSSLFGMNLNSVYYYSEIYGFRQDMVSDAFIIAAKIENDRRDVLKQTIRQNKKFGETMLNFGYFQIDSLPTGTYYLVINVIDTIQSFNLIQEKKFFVFNDKVTADTTSIAEASYLKSEYAIMKEEQIQDEYEKSIYVRKNEETKYFEKLKTIDEKRKFMYDFWKKRDTNPDTRINEFKSDYMMRVAQANLYYKQSFYDGWKTDRGRIYVIYGKPNDIDKHPYESETKSYEIWQYYDIEGGTICVFIEKTLGSGYYQLVHSTIRSELRNDNWKIELKK